MQGNMPREIKDIIRNVQQMDLPENGIADIRIKIQGGEVLDRPMFANGGPVSPFGTSLRQSLTGSPMQLSGQALRLGQGGPDISNLAIGTPMQQQMQSMQQNPLETYKGYLGQKYVGPKQEQELQKVDEFVDLVGRAEQQQFGGGQRGGGQFSNMRQPGLTNQPAIFERQRGDTNFSSGPKVGDIIGGSMLNPIRYEEPKQTFLPPGSGNPMEIQTMGPLADRNDTDRFGTFAAGGAANKFPDLSGDGKVTQKDILIGRGVIEKQEGGAVNPEQAIAQVEMAAEAEGEQVGLDYLANQMGGIDMAEDAEGLINALRGNEMPIAARRTELAEYVGEEDAMRTPESVLAMVQPTIMMTEEGAMNSGIGELMQQLTSDVEMATEGGAPTDMGQGVGALMMAGAPEQPVQQFAAGGAVQYFESGTEKDPVTGEDLSVPSSSFLIPELPQKTLQERYDEFLPFYENIAGTTSRDREKDIALELAKAGFQFASGRGPKGENIAGQPFLSQIGAVGQGAIQEIGDIRTKERATETALRTMAAKSAVDAQTAQLKTQSDIALATSKAANERELQNMKGFVDLQKQVLINNKPQFKNFTDELGRSSVIGIYADGSYKIFGPDATEEDFRPFKNTSPNEMKGGVLKNLSSYGLGQFDDDTAALSQFETSVDTIYKPKSGMQGGLEEALPLRLAQAIVKREESNLALNINPKIVAEAKYVLQNPAKATIDGVNNILEEEKKLTTFIPDTMDIETSYGVAGAGRRALRFINDQVRDLTEGGVGADFSKDQTNIVRSDTALNTLADETLKLQYKALGNARLKAIVDLIVAEVENIRPGAMKTDDKALSQSLAMQQKLIDLNQQAQQDLNLPRNTLTDKEYRAAYEMANNELPILLQSYENLVSLLRGSISGAVDQGLPVGRMNRRARSQDYFKNLQSP